MIPAEVRGLAEDPAAHSPVPPGFERVDDERYCLFFGPSPEMTMAQRLRLEAADVAETVDEVRRIVSEHERSWLTWWVTDSTAPEGLDERLLAMGMERAAPPIHEPVYAAMALTRSPVAEPTAPRPETRTVETFDEFVTAHEIAWDSFGMTDEQRESQRAVLPHLYDLQRQSISATYLAFVDGRPVGCANAVFADAGVMLLGGAVLPEARGRGCYRALVQARWVDGVGRGTPALVVQAGQMSRPILERLGFERVATMQAIVDRF